MNLKCKYRIIETKSGFCPQIKRITNDEFQDGEMWASLYPYSYETYEGALKRIDQAKEFDEENRIIKITEIE